MYYYLLYYFFQKKIEMKSIKIFFQSFLLKYSFKCCCLFLPGLQNSYTLPDITTVQDTTQQRKTVNLPITSSAPNTPDIKQRRKTTYTAQKAKTIGIPAEITPNEKQHASNNKSKLNFFGGFRNTLKSKHKNESDQHNRESTPDKSDLNKQSNDANTMVI